MDEKLQKKIDQLNKSTSNLTGARNATQRKAAETFLTQRAQVLDDERKVLAAWLEEADAYINAESPEINSDETAEYNVQWIEKLHDYEAISNALDSAWSAYMGTMEAA